MPNSCFGPRRAVWIGLVLVVFSLTFWLWRSAVSRTSAVAAQPPVTTATPAPLDFEQWLQMPLPAEAPQQAEHITRGVALAQARRVEMKRLICENPEEALRRALTPEQRERLPAAVAKWVEEPVEGEGFYGVLISCGEESRMEREAVVNGKRYRAHTFGAGLKVLTTERAQIRGVAVDEELAVPAEKGVVALADEPEWPVAAGGPILDPNNPPSSNTPPTEAYNQYTGSFSHQRGPKTVLVILCRPTDGPAWSNPPTFATLSNQLNSSSQWYYDASYRLTWFGPKYVNPGATNEMLIPRLVVTPVLDLPQSSSVYLNSFGTLYSDCIKVVTNQGGIWAKGQPYHPDNFDRIVPMSNVKMITSTGLAYVGGKFAWVGSDLSGGVAIHEWGHNWGVVHANFWDPASTGIARSLGNTHVEYGDGADVMGGGSTGYFNPLFKMDLGFLEIARGEIVPATNSGTYRIFNHADPYARNSNALVRAVMVPITGTSSSSKRLLLGLRHSGGTDGGTGRSDWNRNALEVHSDNTSTNSSENDGSHFLDTTPWSRQTNDKDDGGIKVGRTYSEPANLNGTQIYGGLHITPVARGSITTNGFTHQFMDVVINYGSFPGNQPPTVSLAADNPTPNVNQPVTLTATGNDPNSDPLAYDWWFGDGKYSLTNSPVQTKSWSATGFYRVDCMVTDMKGGLGTNSIWINVGNLAYRDPDNPPSTLPGLYYRYYEGTWAVLPNFNQLLPVKDGTVSTFSLAPRNRNNNFAFRYDGFLDVPAQDVYTFTVGCDDGAKLWIGDTLVVNNDGVKSAPLDATGSIGLKAGKHRIRVEMFNKDNTAALTVSWNTLTMPRQPIPAANLSQTDWAGNAAPVVNITSPASDANFVVGGDVLLQAEATDADGIATVQYFAGSAFIGQATTAPYSVVWTKPSVGAKTVVAVAYDQTGRWTMSAPRNFNVVSPAPANVISINLVGAAGAAGTMNYNDLAGAVQQVPNWNNIHPNGNYATNLTTGLLDHTGNPTTAAVQPAFIHLNGFINNSATTADGSGRMMRGGFWSRDAANPTNITVTGIPYHQYDVYAYFDANATAIQDIQLGKYVLNGLVKYGRNSISTNDSLGDYPSYDTWTGFKEATATVTNAPLDQQLGNYVVFPNQIGSSFRLDCQTQRPLNGLQIVEVPATIPQVIVRVPSAAPVSESGGSQLYSVVLAVAPTAPVTITITPNVQLSANKTSLTFDSTNWNVPQLVTVSAVDDALVEGPHTGTITHTVTAAGNYAGATAAPVTFTVLDNDQTTVAVFATGKPKEGASPLTGQFQFVRTGTASLAAPLTVGFAMTGTAANDNTDYTLTGASVNYDSVAGTGTVVIAAGQAQAFLTLTPVNNGAAEDTETATLTVVAGSGYLPGAPATATLEIADDDALDYFTQRFATGQLESVFDLANRKLTFVPDGSPNFYALTVTNATAFPTSTNGHVNLVTATADDVAWTVNETAVFYGTTNSTYYVGSNGYITFGSSDTGWSPTLASHFNRRRISVYFADMYVSNGFTRVHTARVTGGGQDRAVVTYVNLYKVGDTASRVNAQVELFDAGTLTITYLAAATNNTVVVGLSNRTTGTPSPFYESNLSEYGRSPTNNAPYFASLPVVAGVAGSAYQYAIAAADADGHALAITAPTKPAWLTLTDNGDGTALLAGTAQTGTFDVTLRVTDGIATGQQTFAVTVIPAGGNNLPAFTSAPVTNANAGATYTYLITATDPDGHRLSFSGVQLPAWLSLTDNGNGTAALTGLVPDTGVAWHPVTVGVSDGVDAVSQTFVIRLNRAPVVAIQRPTGRAVIHQAGHLVLEATVTDDGPVTTAWSQQAGPGNATFADPAAPTTSVTFDQPGRYRLRLTANDGAVSGFDELQVFVQAAGTASAILTNNLQGYWKFDEGTGTTTVDSSGNGRTATLTGATMTGSGYSGTAFTSDGANNKFADATYGEPTLLTVSAWVQTEVTPVSNDKFIATFRDSGGNARWRLYQGSGSRRLRVFSDRATDGIWRIEQDLPANEWVHVCVTYDANNAGNQPLAYLNGVAVPVTQLQTPSGTRSVGTAVFRIGGNSSNNGWQGRLDEVRVYDRIVAAEDVPLLMLTSPVGNAPQVDAGADFDTGVNAPVNLAGSVTGDGELAIEWTLVSGPAAPVFGDTGSPTSPVSFPQAGSYVLRLTAGNAQATVFDEVTVTVTAPPIEGWAAWRAANFTAGELANDAISGPLADPDGDGLANLMEYALGLDPKLVNAAPRAAREGDHLTLIYTRLTTATDVTLEPQATGSLTGGWSNAGITVEVIGSDGNIETNRATDNATISGNPSRFMRLRVTSP